MAAVAAGRRSVEAVAAGRRSTQCGIVNVAAGGVGCSLVDAHRLALLHMVNDHCIGHFHYRRSFSPSLWMSQVRLVYGRSPLCVLVTEWSTILNQSWVHYWFIVLQILKFRGRLQNQAGEIEIKSLKSHFLVRLIRIAHQDTSSRYKDIKGSKPSKLQYF